MAVQCINYIIDTFNKSINFFNFSLYLVIIIYIYINLLQILYNYNSSYYAIVRCIM